MCRPPEFRAVGRCPYCGEAFDRLQYHPIDVAECGECRRQFVTHVATDVRRIEGEVTRPTMTTREREFARHYGACK